MDSTISRSLAALALALSPAILAAQTPPSRPADSQEPIPRELALALLNLPPGGNADIRVGRPPDDVPIEMLPPNLQVLGSTTQFESSVIVFVSPLPPDSAITVYESKLVAAGWTKPPVPKAPQMRGFVSADIGQFAYDRPDVACKGESFATFAGSYRRSGGSLLKVTYNRGTRYSMCKVRQETSTYRSPYDEAPVPILRAPFGSMSNGGGGMSASDNTTFTLSTRLTTKLNPAEVVTHYDKQMREQGWSSTGDGAVAFFAAHTYQKNDDQGRPWVSMLVSLTLPDSSQQDVMLRMMRRQASVAK